MLINRISVHICNHHGGISCPNLYVNFILVYLLTVFSYMKFTVKIINSSKEHWFCAHTQHNRTLKEAIFLVRGGLKSPPRDFIY